MIVNGTPVNFGFLNTTNGITIGGFTGIFTLQSAEHTSGSDMEAVKDAGGNDMTHVWYNPRTHATLEMVIIGSGLAAAITNTTLSGLIPGTILSITACANDLDLVKSNWEVNADPKISKSNTGAAKITLMLTAWPNITAAASP
jgi:hypothetical protein